MKLETLDVASKNEDDEGRIHLPQDVALADDVIDLIQSHNVSFTWPESGPSAQR